MLKIILPAMIAFVAAPSLGAGLYKCTDPATGAVVFSQTQCALDAQAVDVDIHRPSSEQIEMHERQIQANQQLIDDGIARRQAKREAAATQRRIQSLKAARAQELASIKARRAHAANNLAGATYINALSQDAANVNDQYNAEMDRLRGVR